MRSIFVFCFVATILAAVTSCGTTSRIEQLPTTEEERAQLWAGKEYSDIVQSYGDPDRIAPDGNDGSILIYETVSTAMETDNDDTIAVEEERYYTHFYLDQEGFCYLVKSNQYVPVPVTARAKSDDGLCITAFGAVAILAIALPIITCITGEKEINEW